MRNIQHLTGNLAPANEPDFGILVAIDNAPYHIDSRFQSRSEYEQCNTKLSEESSEKDLDSCALQGRDIGSNTETNKGELYEEHAKGGFGSQYDTCFWSRFGSGCGPKKRQETRWHMSELYNNRIQCF